MSLDFGAIPTQYIPKGNVLLPRSQALLTYGIKQVDAARSTVYRCCIDVAPFEDS